MANEDFQTAIDVESAAREFAAEVAGSAERKKKALQSPEGLQLFLLYIRAHGTVPAHQVTGPITVQGVLGRAKFTVGGRTFELSRGMVVRVGAGEPHELSAEEESVLLVTHSLRG